MGINIPEDVYQMHYAPDNNDKPNIERCDYCTEEFLKEDLVIAGKCNTSSVTVSRYYTVSVCRDCYERHIQFYNDGISFEEVQNKYNGKAKIIDSYRKKGRPWSTKR